MNLAPSGLLRFEHVLMVVKEPCWLGTKCKPMLVRQCGESHTYAAWDAAKPEKRLQLKAGIVKCGTIMSDSLR